MNLIKKFFCGFVFFILSAIIIYRGNNLLEKEYYIYKSDKVPKKFDGYKILQISDLHNKLFGENNKNLLEQIKEEQPDIIVITGDIYYSYRKKIENSLKFLEEISKMYKVYMVTGNHEYRDNNWKDHSKKIKSYGVKIIDNKVEKIYIEDEFIQIYGLKDPSFYEHKVRYAVFEEKLKRLKDDIDEKNLAMLLSHRPERFSMYARNNVDLVFTGHAHGGQIRIFKKGVLSPSEGFFPKYTGGEYKRGKTTMILSRGLGRTIFTTRLFNRPNIVIATLINI